MTISGRTWAPTEEEQQLWRATYHRLDADGEGCGLMAIVVEITDIARQREELEQARGHVALLSTAAVRIGTTLDMDTTCRELADFVVPDFADVAAVDVFPADVGHSVRRPEPGVVRLRRPRCGATANSTRRSSGSATPGSTSTSPRTPR